MIVELDPRSLGTDHVDGAELGSERRQPIAGAGDLILVELGASKRPSVRVGGARGIQRELPGLRRGVERNRVGTSPIRGLETERGVAIALFLESAAGLLVRVRIVHGLLSRRRSCQS